MAVDPSLFVSEFLADKNR